MAFSHHVKYMTAATVTCQNVKNTYFHGFTLMDLNHNVEEKQKPTHTILFKRTSTKKKSKHKNPSPEVLRHKLNIFSISSCKKNNNHEYSKKRQHQVDNVDNALMKY